MSQECITNIDDMGLKSVMPIDQDKDSNNRFVKVAAEVMLLLQGYHKHVFITETDFMR